MKKDKDKDQVENPQDEQPKNDRSEETDNELVRSIAEKKYEFGFTTDIKTEIIEKGLNEDVVRLISAKKNEPEWLLDFRLKAFRYWQTLEQPSWGHVTLPEIDSQAMSYYAAPSQPPPKGGGASSQANPNSEASPSGGRLEGALDPKIEETFNKLGIPLEERLALSGVAVDAIMDSVSVKTTFKEKLSELGVIFCSIGEAVQEHPELVRKFLGTVVPYRDNFFAALNSAVFSDGSFVYIPKGVRCPMELSSYFRINARNTGQFERTLIVAEDDSYVSYLEGCTAPMRDENQLHAAIVEIIVMDRAEVKYSTVQNWYPGDEKGRGGVLNLVTKRGELRGAHSKLSWTQVETGSAITWKYPSCVLRGDNSVAEFYSVAVTNNYQEADTGTKMIHIGKNTRSTIISKGISAGHSQNSYRGLVRATSNADNARNYSSCDSLLLGSDCGAHTFPYMDIHNETAIVEHEATTSKISEDQLMYCNQRGIPTEAAVGLIVNGYAKEVLQKLPMEFAVEAQKLLSVSLEGTVG
ncbi:MAG: Fe-S cluster assembly protein SufB [Prevotella sp.]|nr:Fe-S cluster assembly protein SufB [Prevotella sp.]